MSTTAIANCKWCGASLSPSQPGPCHNCGKSGRNISLLVTDAISLKESLEWEHRREFYKENKVIKWLIIGITIFSPFLGLVTSGLSGVIIGLIIGIISYFLSPFAVLKIKQITRERVV